MFIVVVAQYFVTGLFINLEVADYSVVSCETINDESKILPDMLPNKRKTAIGRVRDRICKYKL